MVPASMRSDALRARSSSVVQIEADRQTLGKAADVHIAAARAAQDHAIEARKALQETKIMKEKMTAQQGAFSEMLKQVEHQKR